MDRVNEEYLTDIRNTIRVIRGKIRSKETTTVFCTHQKHPPKWQKHSYKTKKVHHIQINLDNSGSIKALLLDYYPSDYHDQWVPHTDSFLQKHNATTIFLVAFIISIVTFSLILNAILITEHFKIFPCKWMTSFMNFPREIQHTGILGYGQNKL